jgi:predicted AAA+ superfamily ATPase
MSVLLEYLNNRTLVDDLLVPKESLAHAVWDGVLRKEEAIARLYAELGLRGIVIDRAIVERLIAVMAELTGQSLSCSHLSHRMGLPPKEVLKMLGVAQLTGMWRHLDSFDRIDTAIEDKSKGYLYDLGLAAQMLGVQSPAELNQHRSWGALFETFIVNRLLRTVPPDCKLFYWRTADGMAEVDVILQRGLVLYPIEIKSTIHASLSNAKKIAIFNDLYADMYTVAPGLIVYAGNRIYPLSSAVFAVSWAAL